MKNKKTQKDSHDALETMDRRLLRELERIVDGLPPRMFGDLLDTGFLEGENATAVQGSGGVALPFLIFIDTRLN
jgi:hypothetical protein